MVEHESVDPKAQGKPEIAMGVTYVVARVVGESETWGARGARAVGSDSTVRSRSSLPERCGRAVLAVLSLSVTRTLAVKRSTPYLAERESGPDSGTELRLRPCDIFEKRDSSLISSSRSR